MNIGQTIDSKKRRVCFFGIYDPDYARTRILMKGFRMNGFEIIECHVDPAAYGRWSKYLELFKQAWKLKAEYSFEHVLVAFPGYTVVWVAFLVFGRNIVFDAFVSLFNANVYDRVRYSSLSLRGRFDWLLDWYSVHLAGTVLVHTEALRAFFCQRFGVSKEKIVNVYLGANESIFHPQEQKREGSKVVVHFHGGFTKVQGLPYLIEAANLLRGEAIVFQLVGAGIEYDKVVSLVAKWKLEDTVKLIGRVPLREVPSYVARADICIGILGDTPNSDLMVPNKVFEYMAMNKPIITADTPAIREIFEDGKSVQLCDKANPSSIAAAIRTLAHSQPLRGAMAYNAHVMFQSRFTAVMLVKTLLSKLEVSE